MFGKDQANPELQLRTALQLVAPGTALRDGLDRIVRGRTGGLVVLGWDRNVEQVTGGGFSLDAEFSATRLRELAKMDGAVVLDTSTNRIVRAAVQLLPDPSIPTEETGTRHRTADRLAKQTGLPVVTVSKSMSTIALFVAHQRYVLEGTPAVLSRASQSIATLERFRLRADQVSSNLAALEAEDLATIQDVALLAQRLEMVRRIRHEIEGYAIELGTDGRLVALQVEELGAGVDRARELLVRDYLPLKVREKAVEQTLAALAGLSESELLEPNLVAKAIGLATGSDPLDTAVSPHGYRLLSRLPRITDTMRDRLVAHFGTLQPMLVATIEDLQQVEGIGETRARFIRDGITRLAEATILDRLL